MYVTSDSCHGYIYAYFKFKSKQFRIYNSWQGMECDLPVPISIPNGSQNRNITLLLQGFVAVDTVNWNVCSRSPLNPPLPSKDSPLLLPLMNMLHTTVSSNYAFKTAQQVTIPTLLAIPSRYLHSLCTAYHLMHSVNHEWLMKPDT